MFQLVTLGAGPVLTPRAYEHKEIHKEIIYTKYQSSKPIIKAFYFEIFFFCSQVLNCDLRGGASFGPEEHHMNKLGRGPQGDTIVHIPNIKALCLPVSEKTNFEDQLLCSYGPTCDVHGRTSPDHRGIIMNKVGRGPQGEAIYQTSKL